jgi:hypothetical protein
MKESEEEKTDLFTAYSWKKTVSLPIKLIRNS